MKLLIFAFVLLLSACASTPSKYESNIKIKSQLNNKRFIETNEAEMLSLYESRKFGKVTIWTNEKFLESSSLKLIDILIMRDIRINFQGSDRTYGDSFHTELLGTISNNTKYTVYLPKGTVTVSTNRESKYISSLSFYLNGGEEKVIFWETPELPIRTSATPLIATNAEIITKFRSVEGNLDSNQGRYLYTKNNYFLELPKNAQSILLDRDEFSLDATKNEKEITLIFKIKEKNSINLLSINENSFLNNKEAEIKYSKKIKFGENSFILKTVGSDGLVDTYQYIFTKLTLEEKKILEVKAKELEVKKLNEEKEMRRRHLEQEKQNILNDAIVAKAKKAEADRIAREGDGSNEDKLCQRYGLKPQTNGYAECRMRLDFAKADSIKQQQQYEREQAAYEQQMAAIQKERERQRAMKQLELGLRMMGGQSPVDAVNSVGTGAPIAPRAPTPTNQTITLPNGRMVNCTTMGTMTNCF